MLQINKVLWILKAEEEGKTSQLYKIQGDGKETVPFQVLVWVTYIRLDFLSLYNNKTKSFLQN